MTFKTINEDGPWEYLPVLNECIKILLTIAIGMIMGYFKIFEAKTFVPHATRFVFYVALPLLVFKGLGVGIDFYDDTFLWNFIGAFLILRVIALVVSFGIVLRNRDGTKKGIGHIAVNWLALTWISTVILGVPISGAVFDDPQVGKTYGILAGISSFIFQLPLQLFILECHGLEQEYLKSQCQQATSDEEQPPFDSKGDDDELLLQDIALEPTPEQLPVQECAPETKPEQPQSEYKIVPFPLWLEFARRGDIWKRIFLQILRNPVLWGIAGGFALSLSTVGPRFLNPTSPDFVPGFLWFAITTGWFGDCVSPVSLFAMGVWMQSQGKKLFHIPALSAVLFMLSKLVIVPLLMVGLAKAANLNDEAGRAAVLIASLPISMASFSLASRYKIGEAILSENVALGTALILPTVLIWNLVMDAVGLFPIAPKGILGQ
jgi:predicted permease